MKLVSADSYIWIIDTLQYDFTVQLLIDFSWLIQ